MALNSLVICADVPLRSCSLTHYVRKILSPSSSLLLLAKTIMHPAARSLCDSWASCTISSWR